MAFIRVLLPAPFGPKMLTISPAPTCRLAPVTMGRPFT